jgi:dissimilatory sulfite reductase (desulfoviridin) alpha/beta subunit
MMRVEVINVEVINEGYGLSNEMHPAHAIILPTGCKPSCATSQRNDFDLFR